MIFSYSFLDQHKNCPEAARQIYVLRAYKKTWTVQGGIDEHKVLEDRLKTKTPRPPSLAASERYVQALEARGTPVEVELSLAVDRSLHPVDFWSKAAWLRFRAATNPSSLRNWATPMAACMSVTLRL